MSFEDGPSAGALTDMNVQLDLPYADAPKISRSLASWQLNRALQLFETNIDRPISVGAVAGAVRLSVSRFSGAFRGSVGEPPGRYLRRCRVKKAQEMMLLTGEPLATIAVECGFADQSHFTRIFSRMVGVSPAAWRRALFSDGPRQTANDRVASRTKRVNGG